MKALYRLGEFNEATRALQEISCNARGKAEKTQGARSIIHAVASGGLGVILGLDLCNGTISGQQQS